MTAPFTTYGLRRDASVNLNASGAGQGVIRNDNSAALWIVRQISVIANPTRSGTTVVTRTPNGIVDTSYFAGTGDVAGGDPPIYLRSGEAITLDWTSGPPSGVGQCTFYYDEIIQ